jgi:hypothetical protein
MKRASGSPPSNGRTGATLSATIEITAEKPCARAVSSPTSTSAIAVSDADPERERGAGSDGGAVPGDVGGFEGAAACVVDDPVKDGAGPERRGRDTAVSADTSSSLSGLRFKRGPSLRERRSNAPARVL